MLPIEVQGYLRHLLHTIGLTIVAKGGMNGTSLEIFVGAGVNLISLGWFLWYEYNKHKKKV